MKTDTEQDLARYLLARRESGFSIAYGLRRSMKRYAVLFGFLLIAVGGCCLVANRLTDGICLWLVGVFLGTLLRDLGWLRMIKGQWPFTSKIIDWQKVEDTARAGRRTAT